MASCFATSSRTCALILLVFAKSSEGLKTAATAPKSFVVDLAKAPHERWMEIGTYYKDIIPGIAHAYAKRVISKLAPDVQLGFIQQSNWPEESKGELRGYAEAVNSSKVSPEKLMLFNMMYELEAMADRSADKGAVVNKPNGEVLHGRNYALSLPFQLPDGTQADLKDFAFEVTFMAFDKPLMTSVHYPGQIGVHTAMRFDGYSLEMNAHSDNNFKQNLVAAQDKSVPVSIALRRAMESCRLLAVVVRRIETTKFMAPMFISLAGKEPSAGIVLKVDRKAEESLPYPNAVALSASMGRWFMTQSSADAAISGEKRVQSSQELDVALETIGEHIISEGALLRALRAKVTDQTSFTWIASPASGYHILILAKDPAVLQPMKE